jgi:hypothetical protein
MPLDTGITYIGQIAIFNYDLAVDLGLQESIAEVSDYGVQVNRSYGASDTIVYIPLIVASIIGLFRRKKWAITTTAAVMGISIYWASTISFMLVFLPGTEGYHLEVDFVYWFFLGTFILFGFYGLIYLAVRGDELIQ